MNEPLYQVLLIILNRGASMSMDGGLGVNHVIYGLQVERGPTGRIWFDGSLYAHAMHHSKATLHSLYPNQIWTDSYEFKMKQFLVKSVKHY